MNVTGAYVDEEEKKAEAEAEGEGEGEEEEEVPRPGRTRDLQIFNLTYSQLTYRGNAFVQWPRWSHQ